MQRFSTLRCASIGIAAAALAACWLAVPAASGRDTPKAKPDSDEIASALGAAAAKLIAAVFSESAGSTPPLAGAVLSATASSSQAAPAKPPAPRPRLLAVVRATVALSEEPGGPATIRVGASTEFGSRRALAVGARRGDWLGVVTTARPNNRLAWVRRKDPGIELRRTRWSLHADLSDRTLTLRKGGRRVHRMTVAVGRPGSETPTGRFAVTDKLSGSSYGPYYGCCILALSGIQPKTPPGWPGGNRLAIHGTDAPSTIGLAASAGCLRASDADLERLMAKVPLGTTLFIRR